jgi:malonyl-CoA O-methyltransferase
MSGGAGAYGLDTPWIRRSFDRASASYDASAVLQREVRSLLLARLELTALAPRVVLDAGAGTGEACRALKARYPKARVLAVDSAPGMLRAAAARRSWFRPFYALGADAARLPLADGSVDLVLSNFMLPWCEPDAVFEEFRRVLAPRGFLTFTTLGPDTLKELRAAWAKVDSHSRVLQFIDMHDLGDALVRAGFIEPVLDVERYTLEYRDALALARDLKAVGARNATAGRLKGLTGPRKFAAMQSAYEAHRRSGRLPATYEVVFGQAWSPRATVARAVSAAGISLEDLRGQMPSRRR